MKYIIFSLLLTTIKSYAQPLAPQTYSYIYVSQSPWSIHIKLNTGKVLVFEKPEQNCDAYVDTCYLDFDNGHTSEYELFGIDPCLSIDCKEEHPNFPNYSLILQKK